MTRISLMLLCSIITNSLLAADFSSDFANTNDRVWLGADYWANPMEDWRVHDGRLECVRGGENRNVHLLTAHTGEVRGSFQVSVRLGLQDGSPRKGSAGFAIGVTDPDTNSPMSALFFGSGISAGITADGVLFLGQPPRAGKAAAGIEVDDVELSLAAEANGDSYVVKFSAHHPESGEILGDAITKTLPADQLVGNLVLVNNHSGNRRPHVAGAGNLARFWFRDWKVSGNKVTADSSARFGPVLYAMHTLSRGVMKLTAQMPPIGQQDSQDVELQIETGGEWKTIAQQKIDSLSRTATFRVTDWDDTHDIPYRLAYECHSRNGTSEQELFAGTIRKDPIEKKDLVIAGFTGNTDPGFPNELIVRNLKVMDPDVLFFSGDQIYEGVGGYGIFREPVPLATLNYLRKIYMWGWAFRDVMRDRPTLVLPDDHDVYQGNIWGQNGRDCGGMKNHSKGGYAMPADWVNAIQRTQVAHHPDAYDPTPIEQGITVYYGDMLYGRISFAVIEDRKFKSGPEGKVNTWKGRPDHVRMENFDPKSIDKPDLVLLGQRQLDFLNDWTADWRGADMKLVVSQTIFCNLANYHGANQQYLVADLDSNGWPQTGRNKALEAMRRGFAFHYAGDQHLPSIVHHGVDDWRDAGYSFCVPSIAAGYPRSWRPDAEGQSVRNRPTAGLPNTGDYMEGLGNRVTVHAIGNPAKKNRAGRINTLHDKSSGFGIVRMTKATGEISIECYRLQIDAKNLQAEDQFPGWPKKIHFTENYGKQPSAWLPTVRVSGIDKPVIQVVDQRDGQIVYTLRSASNTFRPWVFSDSVYTIHVSDPDVGKRMAFKDVKPEAKGNASSLDAAF